MTISLTWVLPICCRVVGTSAVGADHPSFTQLLSGLSAGWAAAERQVDDGEVSAVLVCLAVAEGLVRRVGPVRLVAERSVVAGGVDAVHAADADVRRAVAVEAVAGAAGVDLEAVVVATALVDRRACRPRHGYATNRASSNDAGGDTPTNPHVQSLLLVCRMPVTPVVPVHSLTPIDIVATFRPETDDSV